MTDTNKIEKLLDLWINGESSIDQENELKEYFTSGAEIPAQWRVYQLMFTGFNELSVEKMPGIIQKRRSLSHKLSIYAVAASLLLGSFFLIRYYAQPCCYINGRPVRNVAAAIQSLDALSALDDLRESDEQTVELLKSIGKEMEINEIK